MADTPSRARICCPGNHGKKGHWFRRNSHKDQQCSLLLPQEKRAISLSSPTLPIERLLEVSQCCWCWRGIDLMMNEMSKLCSVRHYRGSHQARSVHCADDGNANQADKLWALRERERDSVFSPMYRGAHRWHLPVERSRRHRCPMMHRQLQEDT